MFLLYRLSKDLSLPKLKPSDLGFIENLVEIINNIDHSIKKIPYKISDYEITISEKDIEQRVKEIAKNQSNFKDKEDKEEAVQGDLIILIIRQALMEKNLKEVREKIPK